MYLMILENFCETRGSVREQDADENVAPQKEDVTRA
jgi:hypothetical protein